MTHTTTKSCPPMITYENLKNKPSVLKNFTGLSHRAFKKLMGAFARAYGEDLAVREEQRAAPRCRYRVTAGDASAR